MDAGMALKPAIGVVSTHAQPAFAAAPAAPTELPAAQTVNPAANIPAVRNDPRLTENTAISASHDAIIDPQTREIVFRVLDARTRQVLQQVPDQALLRLRAYARAQAAQAVADGKDPAAAMLMATQRVNAVA
jgi:hypothetical protein